VVPVNVLKVEYSTTLNLLLFFTQRWAYAQISNIRSAILKNTTLGSFGMDLG
jgi:hypothetical protein